MKKIVLTLVIIFSVFSCKQEIENIPSTNLDNKVERTSDILVIQTTDSLKVNKSTAIDHYICYKDDKVASRTI